MQIKLFWKLRVFAPFDVKWGTFVKLNQYFWEYSGNALLVIFTWTSFPGCKMTIVAMAVLVSSYEGGVLSLCVPSRSFFVNKTSGGFYSEFPVQQHFNNSQNNKNSKALAIAWSFSAQDIPIVYLRNNYFLREAVWERSIISYRRLARQYCFFDISLTKRKKNNAFIVPLAWA